MGIFTRQYETLSAMAEADLAQQKENCRRKKAQDEENRRRQIKADKETGKARRKAKSEPFFVVGGTMLLMNIAGVVVGFIFMNTASSLSIWPWPVFVSGVLAIFAATNRGSCGVFLLLGILWNYVNAAQASAVLALYTISVMPDSPLAPQGDLASENAITAYICITIAINAIPVIVLIRGIYLRISK
jgi:hypothetical protein